MAFAYSRVGRIDEAREAAAIAASENPTHTSSRLLLGILAYESNEFQGAERWMHEVL